MLILKKADEAQIGKAVGTSDRRLAEAIERLVAEGFLARRGTRYYFK